MRADGSGQQRLTTVNGYDGGPFFTPDGKRIVWRRFDESGLIADVWTMNLDGSDQRQVTDFGAMSWAPYFHPSGAYILFASNKLGFENFEVFMVDAQGTKEPVRVTYSDGFDGLPVPSPDGKMLAWTSSRSGGSAGTAVPRAVEPREGARSDQERAAQKAEQEIMKNNTQPQSAPRALRILFSACVAISAVSVFVQAQASKTRTYVETLASPRLEGRLAGSNGERLASDFLVAELPEDRRQATTRAERLPPAVRIHRRLARWRLDARAPRHRRLEDTGREDPRSDRMGFCACERPRQSSRARAVVFGQR
jgi:hypothetical protein